MRNLEELRKAAIEADKCFSKATLKNEYRMRPTPDSKPVKFFDNGYGGEFGVYRIADCVPMQEKRPVTEKQIASGKRLATRAKIGSKKGKASVVAQALLATDPLFIDTETTGLDDHDQVIEIAVVDIAGQVLLETRLRPTVAIHPEAQAVHGISAAELESAPTWSAIAPALRKLFEGRTVVAFNHNFDSRLLQQTALAFGDDYRAWKVVEECAMELAVQAYGSQKRGRISLFESRMEAWVKQQGKEHSALGDVLTTLAVVKAMAAYLKDQGLDQEPDQQPVAQVIE